MNNVSLMGRLVRTPELKRTQEGTAVVSFTMAVDRGRSKSSGEKQTDFIDCVAWNKTAEHIAQFFTKGQMMAVSGSLRTRTWEDRNGDKHKAVEVMVNMTFFCGSKPASSPEQRQAMYDGVDTIDDRWLGIDLDENGQPIDDSLPY